MCVLKMYICVAFFAGVWCDFNTDSHTDSGGSEDTQSGDVYPSVTHKYEAEMTYRNHKTTH